MIWITGGGTGGHFFPALHIAQEWTRRRPHDVIRFIGASRGMEARVLPQHAWPFTLLPVRGNLRQGPVERLQFYSGLARSMWTCRQLLRRERPMLVLGTGGYASFPAAEAALQKGIPLFLQEQNAQPGEVTRRLAAGSRSVFTGFPGLEAKLAGATVVRTGNPVRTDIRQGDRWRGRQAGGFAPEDRVLLVLGGSGGAQSLNRAVLRIARMLNLQGGIRIWWQTGRRDYDSIRAQIEPELFPGTVTPFIDFMPDAYAAADVVLARAGAMTVAEVCAVGKPSVLVPFPHAAGGHQKLNVEWLLSEQATIMVENHELDGEKLPEVLLTLSSDPTLQAKLAAAARRLGRPTATADIVTHMEAVL
jgi:UDP-N-acetylglucosamine--N-acetylmuramyl-(pentapeptide) pyrophosphoryl-undecaprenol N-acetylglucosamine transferase